MAYVHTGPTLVDLYERLTRASYQQQESHLRHQSGRLLWSAVWPVWRPGVRHFAFTTHCWCLFSRWPYQWMGSWPPRATHRKTTPCWARMISSMWVGAPALLICLDLLSATTSWAVSRRYTIDALLAACLVEIACLTSLLLAQQLNSSGLFPFLAFH